MVYMIESLAALTIFISEQQIIEGRGASTDIGLPFLHSLVSSQNWSCVCSTFQATEFWCFDNICFNTIPLKLQRALY
jgi:hypothetical protein